MLHQHVSADVVPQKHPGQLRYSALGILSASTPPNALPPPLRRHQPVAAYPQGGAENRVRVPRPGGRNFARICLSSVCVSVSHLCVWLSFLTGSPAQVRGHALCDDELPAARKAAHTHEDGVCRAGRTRGRFAHRGTRCRRNAAGVCCCNQDGGYQGRVRQHRCYPPHSGGGGRDNGTLGLSELLRGSPSKRIPVYMGGTVGFRWEEAVLFAVW